MSQLDWTPGDTAPERQGYYETRLDTGGTAISLYSVLGWMPLKTPGNLVSWRALPPAVERDSAVFDVPPGVARPRPEVIANVPFVNLRPVHVPRRERIPGRSLPNERGDG